MENNVKKNPLATIFETGEKIAGWILDENKEALAEHNLTWAIDQEDSDLDKNSK